MSFRPHHRLAVVAFTLTNASCVANDLAASAGMPWESPFNKSIRLFAGPWPIGISIVVGIAAVLVFFLAEHGDGMRSFLKVIGVLSAVVFVASVIVRIACSSAGLP